MITVTPKPKLVMQKRLVFLQCLIQGCSTFICLLNEPDFTTCLERGEYSVKYSMRFVYIEDHFSWSPMLLDGWECPHSFAAPAYLLRYLTFSECGWGMGMYQLILINPLYGTSWKGTVNNNFATIDSLYN